MPCMHIAFSHCFRWHFLFADKRVSGNKNYRMYLAIKQIQILGYTDYRKVISFTESVISSTERKLQYTANLTQKHKKFAIHCKFLEKVSYICSAFHF